MAEEKTTKVKKKRWYQIVGPGMFKEAVLGETLVAEPQSMIDKTLKVNLMNLTHDIKQQNVNVKFQISELRGERAVSQIIGYEIIPATIRRLVRRGKKRMDISFLCETSDKVRVRIKPLLITKKTMKSSVNAALRKSIIDYLTINIKKMNYNNLVSNLIYRKLQYSLRDHIKKIYPLRICEIREMSIEKEVAPEEKVKELIKPKEKKKEVKEEKEEAKEKPKKVRKEEKKESKTEAPKEVSETQRVSEHAQKSKNSKEFLGHENPKDSHKSTISDKKK